VRVRRSPRRLTDGEDAAAVIPVHEDALVLAVADGVGGAPGGRLAANVALAGLVAAVSANTHAVQAAIVAALRRVNERLVTAGMGSATTVAAAEISGRSAHTYHVGDSEVLIVGQRGRQRHRIVPHSPTGIAVHAGILDEDDALHHDYRHVLLNVVGNEHMRIHIEGAVQLRVRDTVLVVTDGVLDNLYLSEIVEIIRCGSLSAAADRLVAEAVARMTGARTTLPSKPDDLAVLLFRYAVRPRKPARQRAVAAEAAPLA